MQSIRICLQPSCRLAGTDLGAYPSREHPTGMKDTWPSTVSTAKVAQRKQLVAQPQLLVQPCMTTARRQR